MADNRDEWILQTVEDCENYINEVGFLPLFASEEFPGGSVQERTKPWVWWTGNEKTDPCLWREQIAAKGTIAYGKFFHGRAGFVSREWFPYLANYRRAGYDYDSRWDEGLATNRSRKIMSLFMEENADKELFSFEVKRMAGFGKEGEKNFEGTVTDLQMRTYLVIREFRQRLNKKGEPYGWPLAVYCTPEHLWGYDHITSQYEKEPEESGEAIYRKMRNQWELLSKEQFEAFMKVKL